MLDNILLEAIEIAVDVGEAVLHERKKAKDAAEDETGREADRKQPS